MAAFAQPMYGYMAPSANTPTSSTTVSANAADLGVAIAAALSGVLDAQGRELVTYSILNKRRLSDADLAAFVQSHPDNEFAKNALASGESLRKVALQSVDPEAFQVLQQAKAARAHNAIRAFARRLPALARRVDRDSPLHRFLRDLLDDPDFAALLHDH